MTSLLVATLAWTATFTASVERILPVAPAEIAYAPSVSVTMTRTGGKVWCHAVLKGAQRHMTFRWNKPGSEQMEFSKTITARGETQRAGDWVTESGPGMYAVWVYDGIGRQPFGYGCLVIPTP